MNPRALDLASGPWSDAEVLLVLIICSHVLVAHNLSILEVNQFECFNLFSTSYRCVFEELRFSRLMYYYGVCLSCLMMYISQYDISYVGVLTISNQRVYFVWCACGPS